MILSIPKYYNFSCQTKPVYYDGCTIIQSYKVVSNWGKLLFTGNFNACKNYIDNFDRSKISVI